jgi:hypothetical protein
MVFVWGPLWPHLGPLQVRFATMERQHNALSDELWGDELSLAKAGHHQIACGKPTVIG